MAANRTPQTRPLTLRATKVCQNTVRFTPPDDDIVKGMLYFPRDTHEDVEVVTIRVPNIVASPDSE